jgi:predicted dehydrogenase
VSRVRIGLLGAGNSHAPRFLEALRECPEYEVVGVAEPDESFREVRQRQAQFQGVRWVEPDELLGDPSIPLLAVEAHTAVNLEWAQKVVEAGKHLHLDKPPGPSLNGFRKVVETARRRGLVVHLGYMFRCNAGFELSLRALREGWLGDVHLIEASMNGFLKPALRTDRKSTGFHRAGLLFEMGCHLVDMLVAHLGRPARVAPFLRHDGPYDDDYVDNTHVVLEYERALAHLSVGSLEIEDGPRREWTLVGTKGTLVLQPLEPPAARLSLAEPVAGFQKGWQSVELPWAPRFERDVRKLASYVRGEARPEWPYDHDLLAQETLLRAVGDLPG